ncbi:MAG: GNAT family N-acetyltransferase [Myxococcota bacterium]
MRLRAAGAADAPLVAALHAESWRAHYRGAYRDTYLDGDVVADRQRVWEERLGSPPPNQHVVLAEEGGEPLGFACVYGTADPRWGSLLDNLHVRPAHQGRRVGAHLVADVVAWCRQHHPACGLYLWVLAENEGAQRFYRRLGASDRGGELSEPPGGGTIHGRRYVWTTLPDPASFGLPTPRPPARIRRSPP